MHWHGGLARGLNFRIYQFSTFFVRSIRRANNIRDF